MGILVFPVLLFLVAPMPDPPARMLKDFSRFSGAIGQEVTLIDSRGVSTKGIVEKATNEGVILRTGPGSKTFDRAEVASAERMKDSPIDGLIKGTIVGLVLTAGASQGYDSSTSWYAPMLSVGAFSGLGFLLDVTNDSPRPLYRAPAPPAPR